MKSVTGIMADDCVALKIRLDSIFPSPYYLLLKPQSYITDRYFQIKFSNSYSNCYQVKSDIPQGSVMGLLLYLIYPADMPTAANNITIATYPDDTACLAANNDPIVASQYLQYHLNLLWQ
jgi:hypothetical protein